MVNCAKIRLNTGSRAYVYREFRGFSSKPFNEREITSFVNVILAQFQGIRLVDQDDIMKFYRRDPCDMFYSVKIDTDAPFTPAMFQISEKNQLLNCVVSASHGRNEDIPKIPYPPNVTYKYSYAELCELTNLTEFAKYFDTTYGRGLSAMWAKYLVSGIRRARCVLANCLRYDDVEILTRLVPKSSDYRNFYDIIALIEDAQNLVDATNANAFTTNITHEFSTLKFIQA
ncbi:MAG: hypothetical protein MUO31_05430 [Thermodesulfovibrionales bacterium]|nr:hypothetical protein [Thermodesulfovibrionales bacterium]